MKEAFKFFEKKFKTTDNKLLNLLSVGLLEDIQNISGNTIRTWESFEKYLGKNTKIHWFEIIRMWEGK